MPFTINAIGTTYYGKRDLQPDGSYVTTEWVVFLFVPLIPLRSRRLIRDPGQDVNAVLVTSQGYLVLERIPLHVNQVLSTYLLLASLVGLEFAAYGLSKVFNLNTPNNPVTLFLLYTAPFYIALLVPVFLQWQAQRKVKFSEEALLATLAAAFPMATPPPLPPDEVKKYSGNKVN